MNLILACVLALAASAVQPAQAGTTTPFISGAYYEQNGTATCPPITTSSGASSSSGGSETLMCQVLFAGPPTGKKISLEGVSCKLRIDQFHLNHIYLAVNLNGNLQRKQYLDAHLVREQTGGWSEYLAKNHIENYAVTSPVRIVMESDVATEGHLTMDCQISGTLQPL